MNRLSILIGVLLLSQPGNLIGQYARDDITALAAVVEAEKQRIAELQAELNRRNAALLEISGRLDALAGRAVAASPSPATVPPEPYRPHFDFYAESVMRLDTLHESYAGCTLCPAMTFDVDLFPEGLTERFSFDSNKSGALKNISLQGMQLVANEQAASDAMIVGGQISSRFSLTKRLSTTAAFTGMTFRHPEYLLRGQFSKLDARVRSPSPGNSARSQMAEGLMRNLAGDRYDVFSAGTNPKVLHPISVEVMRELGIDVGHQKSNDVNTYVGQHFDFAISVRDRARQHCPVFPGSEPIHWGFDDPAEAEVSQQRQAFSRVRDEISQRIRLFVAANRD